MMQELISIDTLQSDNELEKVQKLTAIKNEVIGSLERKEAYFDLGLPETLF